MYIKEIIYIYIYIVNNFNGRFYTSFKSYKLICHYKESNKYLTPSLGGKTLVGNHRGQTFLVVGHQVCTHLRRDFVPLLFADPLQVIKVLRRMFGNSNLQLPPQIFYVIKVCRLAGPLQDLNVLLLEPLLCCLGRVFWVIVMLEYPSTTHFQCPGWLQYPGPDIPLMRCSCPVPLAEKHPQSIMFPPPCLTVGWCSWGHRQHSSSSKHGELS